MKIQALLHRVCHDQGGFYTENDISQLAQLDRLRLVLVRCNNCRFLAAAQDVEHIIGAVESVGDWARDCSMPTSDPVYRGEFAAITPAPQPAPSALAPVPSDGVAYPATYPRHYGGDWDSPSDADCGL